MPTRERRYHGWRSTADGCGASAGWACSFRAEPVWDLSWASRRGANGSMARPPRNDAPVTLEIVWRKSRRSNCNLNIELPFKPEFPFCLPGHGPIYPPVPPLAIFLHPFSTQSPGSARLGRLRDPKGMICPISKHSFGHFSLNRLVIRIGFASLPRLSGWQRQSTSRAARTQRVPGDSLRQVEFVVGHFAANWRRTYCRMPPCL